jgi:hypothetical protein
MKGAHGDAVYDYATTLPEASDSTSPISILVCFVVFDFEEWIEDCSTDAHVRNDLPYSTSAIR